ncbi:MAG: radical SAM protein [Deltaproteobacteria bacterium]|nr:MAG: radical SAM protein [Deltaproteobacteria bacterium]
MPKNYKLVLVQPSTHEGVQSLFTFHKKKGLGAKPPLGIMTLATYLISRGFAGVSCLDAQLDQLSPEETVAQLAALKPDLVGITVWTDFWYPCFKTIKLLKQRLPGCKVVLGGPHCAIYPFESLENSGADFLVAGDGEDTLLGLAEALDAGAPVGDFPGLWRNEEGKIQAPSEPLAVIKDLGRIPPPDRRLLPYERYGSVLNPRDFETTMVTSRGCPFKCVFCKIYSQNVCIRPAEQVIEEFREIAALGIKDIQVYDDTFTWSKKRVMEICRGILDLGLEVRWAVRDRVNKADREMYHLMKRAGCYRIHFGVESGSRPILAATGKAITLEEAERAVALAKDAGFDTLAYYMFGFLDETYKDALATIAFSLKLDTDYAVYAVLIPYPGTKIYEKALERGLFSHDFWREFVKNPVPDFQVRLLEQNLDRATLLKLNNLAMRRFYFRPGRIAKELWELRSFTELGRKTAMVWNMVTDLLKR